MGGNVEKLCYAAIVTLTIMVWGVFGLFRIGELVVSGKAKFARVLKWRHVRLSRDEGLNVLIVYLDGSKTDPFRRGVEVRLCQQDDQLMCPIAWGGNAEAWTEGRTRTLMSRVVHQKNKERPK